ncbi:MAG: 4Fe-4S binding protein [Candidatus Sumerlaeia bacterium]|nr:4Fe-4S binding protein [Candidatus Sumerlaeia bacterium]
MKKRTTYQLAALLALHSSWGPEVKWLCNPVLSCHSCPLSWFACPIGVFVHYAGYHLFPFVALGTVLLIGVLAGRLFCGWICPFGYLQDLLYKIRWRKIVLPDWTRNIKYLVLVFLVLLIPYFLGETTHFSFCRFCPAATIQAALPSVISTGQITYGTVARFAVLFAVIGFVIVARRGFCRVLCPIGALMAPLNYLSWWVVRRPRGQCLSCRACDRLCPTDVHPSERFSAGLPANRALDCIVCHDCQGLCPAAAAGHAACETPR